MGEVNYVCSLGPRCHTAQFLKRNKLKLASYPFDWIFANLDMVMHCLGDDFDTLLDKRYFTINDVNSKSQQHSIYYGVEDEPVFNHHNPLKEEDHNYFVRCIQRFRNLLKRPELKMFIVTFLNYKPIDEAFKNDIVELNKLLSKKTKNYGLLCIVQQVSQKNSHKFTFKENIHFLEINTKSPSDGLEFANNEDNIYFDKVIMTTYNFKLKEIDVIQKKQFIEEIKTEEESDSESDLEVTVPKVEIQEEIKEEILEEILKLELSELNSEESIEKMKNVTLENIEESIQKELITLKKLKIIKMQLEKKVNQEIFKQKIEAEKEKEKEKEDEMEDFNERVPKEENIKMIICESETVKEEKEDIKVVIKETVKEVVKETIKEVVKEFAEIIKDTIQETMKKVNDIDNVINEKEMIILKAESIDDVDDDEDVESIVDDEDVESIVDDEDDESILEDDESIVDDEDDDVESIADIIKDVDTESLKNTIIEEPLEDNNKSSDNDSNSDTSDTESDTSDDDSLAEENDKLLSPA